MPGEVDREDASDLLRIEGTVVFPTRWFHRSRTGAAGTAPPGGLRAALEEIRHRSGTGMRGS